jgi:hypothetical protein
MERRMWEYELTLALSMHKEKENQQPDGSKAYSQFIF